MKKKIEQPKRKSPIFTCKNLEKIFEAVGTKTATKILNRTANLHLWRNSSPYNWWVAPIKNEHDYIWHSSDDIYTRKVPPIKVFATIKTEGFVSYSKSYLKLVKPNDNGKPMYETLRIDYRMIAVWNKLSPTQKREIKKKYSEIN